MVIPQFSLRWLVLLILVLGVVFFFAGPAVRSVVRDVRESDVVVAPTPYAPVASDPSQTITGYFAMGFVFGLGALTIAFGIFGLFFFGMWALSLVVPGQGGLRGSSPFVADANTRIASLSGGGESNNGTGAASSPFGPESRRP